MEGFARFDEILAAHPRALVMVDIPIGLLDAGASGYRACDREAKVALGARGSSIFVPPTRAQLALADRPFRAGLGISAQTHAILPKIREVDAHRQDPRVREAHPELAFLLASGGRALPPKRSPEGRAARGRIRRRLDLLFEATGLGIEAKRDDVDDAAILCWLAEQAIEGRVGHYGEASLAIWGAPLAPRKPKKPMG